jgi:hypothetical protein
MFKTAGTIFAVLAIGTVAIAWSQKGNHQQPARYVETISPEKLLPGSGPLSEQQFNDRSFVFTDND